MAWPAAVVRATAVVREKQREEWPRYVSRVIADSCGRPVEHGHPVHHCYFSGSHAGPSETISPVFLEETTMCFVFEQETGYCLDRLLSCGLYEAKGHVAQTHNAIGRGNTTARTLT